MSENILRLIPSDPAFVPTALAQSQARHLLQALFAASSVEVTVTECPTFVDPGSNLDAIYCPACGTALETTWWQDAMDHASGGDFAYLDVITPCCRGKSSLNDLRYDWPAGFASFHMEVSNPGVPTLDPAAHQTLAEIIGAPLRVIWARA